MPDERVDEAKGRIKKAAGALTDDPELEKEGELDRLGASVKEKVSAIVEGAKDRVQEWTSSKPSKPSKQ